MIAFYNDRFIPVEEVNLSVNDLSIQRGYGLFDFFKTINNKPVFLDDHLNRFYYSATQLFLPVPYNRNELKDILYQLINRNKLCDSGIRITLTGGNSEDGYSIGKPNLIIVQKPLNIPSVISNTPYKLMTHVFKRSLPDVKSIDYLMAVWLQKKCRKENYDDILYTYDDHLLECPRSNIFIVDKNNTLLTPQNNILKGITRNRLINIARRSFKVEERPVTINELSEAKEVFITSTTKMILPVSQVDHTTYVNHEVATFLFTELSSAINSDIVE